uniref:Endonuclease n=1 Tax=Ignisphaera aggregans TaxID=334771 RepID=A0A7J2U0D6_9CREN
MAAEVLLLVVLFVVVIIAVYLYARSKAFAEARRLFEEWRQRELSSIRHEVESEVRKEYEAKLQQWLQENEKRISEDAIQKSLATILGRVGEELAPLIMFASYGIEPKDLRHIGSPIDYIAFKGYSKGEVEEIIFFEVKTGKTSRLTDVERSVRDAIASGKVRYVVINIKEELEKLQATLIKQHPEETAEQTPDKTSSSP